MVVEAYRTCRAEISGNAVFLDVASNSEFAGFDVKVEYAFRVDKRTAQVLAALADTAEEVCTREISRQSAILLGLAMIAGGLPVEGWAKKAWGVCSTKETEEDEEGK